MFDLPVDLSISFRSPYKAQRRTEKGNLKGEKVNF